MSGEQYDPVANPYAPGAGTPPPALVGRDDLIAAAEVSLRRLVAARSSQHLLLAGLRGVGERPEQPRKPRDLRRVPR